MNKKYLSLSVLLPLIMIAVTLTVYAQSASLSGTPSIPENQLPTNRQEPLNSGIMNPGATNSGTANHGTVTPFPSVPTGGPGLSAGNLSGSASNVSSASNTQTGQNPGPTSGQNTGQNTGQTPVEPKQTDHSKTTDAPSKPGEPLDLAKELLQKGDNLTSEEGIVDSLKVFLVLTVLSLVPAIFMMTTSFIRLVTVLSILRQALGTGQIPPNQVLTALSVFLSLLIMVPVWTEVYDNAVVPYSHQQMTAEEAYKAGSVPIRTFMIRQMERCGNTDDIWLFMKYIPDAKMPEYQDEIPWSALLPAFMVSELKTAFLIGFQIFLPFVLIDLVVSGVMVSMGMMMLPPVIVSLPFKLMLFVLMDGWTLIVKMLLDSFVWQVGG